MLTRANRRRKSARGHAVRAMGASHEPGRTASAGAIVCYVHLHIDRGAPCRFWREAERVPPNLIRIIPA
jgi:hypothetical protein